MQKHQLVEKLTQNIYPVSYYVTYREDGNYHLRVHTYNDMREQEDFIYITTQKGSIRFFKTMDALISFLHGVHDEVHQSGSCVELTDYVLHMENLQSVVIRPSPE